ncbi:MAG TPA: RidA family protein, partial [Actinomycetota bacterium]|nr:RidA family protein [Actinomycetota bacterium]
MSGPHELLNPPALAPPRGFSHAVAAAPGRIVYIGGQAGMDSGWKLVEGGLVAQFDAAAANVVTALAAAQGEPRHLVQIHIFVTSA